MSTISHDHITIQYILKCILNTCHTVKIANAKLKHKQLIKYASQRGANGTKLFIYKNKILYPKIDIAINSRYCGP
jgi:hypothetical protein